MDFQTIVILDCNEYASKALSAFLINKNSEWNVQIFLDIKNLQSFLQENHKNSCILVNACWDRNRNFRRTSFYGTNFVVNTLRKEWKKLEPVILYSFFTRKEFLKYKLNIIIEVRVAHYYVDYVAIPKEVCQIISNAEYIMDQYELKEILQEVIDLKTRVCEKVNYLLHELMNLCKKHRMQLFYDLKDEIPPNLHEVFDICLIEKLLEQNKIGDVINILSKFKTKFHLLNNGGI